MRIKGNAIKNVALSTILWSRAVYGVYISVFSFNTLLQYSENSSDVISGNPSSATLVVLVTWAFYITDTLAIFVVGTIFNVMNMSMLIHHLIIFFCSSLMLLHDKGHYFMAVFLAVEVILPFLAIAFTIQKSKVASTSFGRVFEFMFLHGMHMRHGLEIHLWYMTFKYRDRVIAEWPVDLLVSWIILLAIMTFYLGPLWMFGFGKRFYSDIKRVNARKTD
ncbi:uncharacterized protein LOC101850483 [Aplysia californica]|uniref:Uncharacterized protein LOC101850483 n=1 Tax=Aplysia californica TaxID=6500 RepID=A0ABM0JRP2_APLCA|nr:uncharacterized protein LOC101850483 [Aplysia californica]